MESERTSGFSRGKTDPPETRKLCTGRDAPHIVRFAQRSGRIAAGHRDKCTASAASSSSPTASAASTPATLATPASRGNEWLGIRTDH